MADPTLLMPGDSCWRLERADRLHVIVDGAEYFRTIKRAMLDARQTIMLIGWDFDTRIEFEPEGPTMEGPNELGPFMKWMAENREDVDLYMLKWDVGTLQALGRGMVPMALRPIRGADNFHFKFDTVHPAGAAHHSKIIAIDDRIGFCGGIDVTAGRWDTPDHLDRQPNRHMPGDDAPSKPWHDMAVAVSGPVAAALGELSRQRWYRATGDELTPPEPDAPTAWPAEAATLTDLPVAIARTYPALDDFPEAREVEALYLKAIAQVRDIFYVETQYLASGRIARAIADRLAEPEGPEFVVLLPETSEGWLRSKAMDGARRKLLSYLWANDPHGHFAAYYPVAAEGAAIYVHAKFLAMDDRMFRLGSSNLNNRSMGFDTECDVAVEAAVCDDPAAVARTIVDLRLRLLAEHLDVPQETVAAAIDDRGLIGAIEHLRGSGKTLVPFTRGAVSDDDSIMADNDFADPEAVEDGLAQRLSDGVRDLVREASS